MMRERAHVAWPLLGALMLALACSGTASAQTAAPETTETPAAEPTAEDLAAARELFRAGVTAGEQRRWLAALDLFERAHALSRRADVWLNVAVAQAELGHLLEASRTYRRFQAEATPAMLTEHGASVTTELAELDQRIAHVRLTASGLEPGDTILLDGAAVDRAALDTILPSDPGDHVAMLVRDSVLLDTKSFHLTDGETQTVALVGAPIPVRIAVVAEPAALPGAMLTEASPPPREDHTVAIVLGVVGGLLVVGAGVGVGVYFATTPTEAPSYAGTIPPFTIDVR